MTIRSDVSVDWSTSPRIVMVAAPSAEITVQDLVDTCRNFEDLSPNSSRKKLIDAAGKEFLGGTTYVGITATLQNAVIAFEARAGPGWELCTISGGNVVAIDAAGGIIDPRYPTAFVTVDRTASASATLQEQSAIQYASFGGQDTVEAINGTPRTAYPIGTIETPVDNLPDALLIAAERGFHTLYFQESMTIAGVDVTEYTLVGASRAHVNIVIDATASCNGITVKNCGISGVICGEVNIIDCSVGDLSNVNGHIFQSELYGTITLGGAVDSSISNCYMQDLNKMPIIDMGGTGQSIFVSDWSGGIKFRNMTGPNHIGIQMDGGKVFLEPTISAGFVGVVGIGLCVDQSTGATIDTTGLLNTAIIADGVWDEILSGATHNIPGSAGRRVREIGAFAIHSGTAQAGNSNSITLATTADANDGVYNRNLLVLVDNTGVGQTRTIADYDGTTKVAVIDRDWRISPDDTTAYQIVPDDTPLVVDHGVARDGTSNTITIREYASTDDDIYLCNIIAVIAGTGRGQARLVGSYDGTTKIVTICGDDWVTTPDTTSVYVMVPFGTSCTSCISDIALDQLGDAVWDEDLSTHTTSGTAGKIVSSIKKGIDAIIAFVT